MLEAPAPPAGDELAAAVGAPGRVVLGDGGRAAELDRARRRAGDARMDRPGGGEDLEVVAVGVPTPAQIHDGLARAVARELGLGAVGVEDAQRRHVARVVAGSEQQDAVRADAQMRVAQPADAPGVSSHGSSPASMMR